MKKIIFLLLLCAICVGLVFGAHGESAGEPALSVAYAAPGALPKDAYTGGNFLWMREKYASNKSFTFTANEPLTDVAFCMVDFTPISDEEEAPVPGRILYKLPDMNPGDTAHLHCAFDDDMIYTVLSHVAIRYKNAAGDEVGAVPYLADGDTEGEGELGLMSLAVSESREPVNRGEIEETVKALYEAFEKAHDEETAYAIEEQYLDVLARDPLAEWAHLGLGKIQIDGANGLDGWHMADALPALNAAISLGENSAEAYWLRALAEYDMAMDMYGYAEEGTEGWPLFLAAMLDAKRAIETKPADFPYDCDAFYVEVLNEIGYYHEADIHQAKIALENDPFSGNALRELIRVLNIDERFDEAAEALAAWRAVAMPDAAPPIYLKADEAYEAGMYEEAIRLYREAIIEGDGLDDKMSEFPVRVWYRLTDAYMRLERYNEAAAIFDEMAQWYPSYYEANAVFYTQCAQALVLLGQIGQAEAMLYDSFDLYENPPGWALLKKIEAMLPAPAKKVFAGEEWEGYEPVATGYYDWSEKSGLLVTVMRRDGHNVLCVLDRRDAAEGYKLIVANDRAVRQGDCAPELYIEDAMGFVFISYADADAPAGLPTAEGYVFCSRWYWEEEMEQTASGDWEYMLLDAYRVYPEPHSPGYAYYGTTRLSMSFDDEKLVLQGRAESYDNTWDSWETLAEMDADTATYDLALFDIARCDADFAALAAMADQESIQYFTGNYAYGE